MHKILELYFISLHELDDQKHSFMFDAVNLVEWGASEFLDD